MSINDEIRDLELQLANEDGEDTLLTAEEREACERRLAVLREEKLRSERSGKEWGLWENGGALEQRDG